MFIIVAAVCDSILRHTRRASKPTKMGHRACCRCSTAALDPAKAVYENKARLYFARLLDSTRVAIEVGRERMGTDKRPGTIESPTRAGKQLAFSIKTTTGTRSRKSALDLLDDPRRTFRRWRRRQRPPGSRFASFPPGTQNAPTWSLASCKGPVVNWQWRTDLSVPRFQPVVSDTAVFDSSSEEGAMLINRWGFEPKVLLLPSQCSWSDHRESPEKTSSRHPRVRI